MTSCTTIGRGIDRTPDPVVVDTACKWVVPIYISKSQDNLSPETARQILAHNEAWKRNCGNASK
ncbi:putative Rz1 protein [Xanthomonas phage Pfeifenkraut]|uniref:Rz1 protein n=1 Tax=Xanthomonas phage Pfeifenkraut TaxID=2939132 RepID=A0A9E7J654_9CAUD|nr:putative Rz1 protein [Xanthomonas phage Pfeifenkraut]URA06929.1 putative Rz1 protein [Xanthomonas phage Pfeifenkraut]